MHRNRVWKHQPSGPWSSKSLQRQRGAIEPFIKKPDRPLCWQTLSLPRNKKIYPSLTAHTHARAHTYVNLCIYFQWRADAAGLHGNSARPRWKEENEAGGGAETAEGVGGWRSSRLCQEGQWKKERRWRSLGGHDGGPGGPGGSVLAPKSGTQTTVTQKSCFIQWIQQHQQWQLCLRQTSKTAPLLTMFLFTCIGKKKLIFLLKNNTNAINGKWSHLDLSEEKKEH